MCCNMCNYFNIIMVTPNSAVSVTGLMLEDKLTGYTSGYTTHSRRLAALMTMHSYTSTSAAAAAASAAAARVVREIGGGACSAGTRRRATVHQDGRH